MIGMLHIFKLTIYRSIIIGLCLLPVLGHAKNIDFKDFKLTGTPDRYQINTRVDFVLTESLRSALQNGVTLNARIQFRLGEHKSWWFDADKSLLTVSYQLKYHALSRHYLLSRNDTNEHWNFANLPSAIRKLSDIHQYVLPSVSAKINDDGEYYILATAGMEPSRLRLPLRFQSLFSNQYKLTSEGVIWPLP